MLVPALRQSSATVVNLLYPASYAGKLEGSVLPDRGYLLELKRPWKLATFCIGMAWLLYGALTYGISDWDVGISLLMGGLTYLTAPWCVKVMVQSIKSRQRFWLFWIVAALAVALFVIDGEYYLYHTWRGNRMLRAENFCTSSALFFLAGCLWLYEGSLAQFSDQLRKLLGTRKDG